MASKTSYQHSSRKWFYARFAEITGKTGDEAPLLEARREFAIEFGPSASAFAHLARVLLERSHQTQADWPDRGFSPEGRELVDKHALELVRAGLELEPDRPGLWEVLGLIHYFHGDAKGAVHALARQDELDREDDPLNWLWLARAELALGDEDQARARYARTLAWMAIHPEESGDQDLQWLRAEAARGLGLE